MKPKHLAIGLISLFVIGILLGITTSYLYRHGFYKNIDDHCHCHQGYIILNYDSVLYPDGCEKKRDWHVHKKKDPSGIVLGKDSGSVRTLMTHSDIEFRAVAKIFGDDFEPGFIKITEDTTINNHTQFKRNWQRQNNQPVSPPNNIWMKGPIIKPDGIYTRDWWIALPDTIVIHIMNNGHWSEIDRSCLK